MAVNPVRLGYILLFGVTALVCFIAIVRARDRLEDQDTRQGLVSLLLLSGLWAAFHAGRIAVPTRSVKLTLYLFGLAVGLATVGAWLYFCSAYAGESYHRQRGFRWLAVGVYATIVSIKFTSPIHGLYFTTTPATIPFPHLVIELGVLHWVVTGLSYALSAIGFYILFDLFQESNYATRRLGVLVSLAGVPVVFDIIGYTRETVVTLNYEPIGVALFALGVLYIADGSFLAVRQFGREQLIDELDEAIILLDTGGVIRDVNAAARQLIPALNDSIGSSLASVAPDIAAYRPVEKTEVIEFGATHTSAYYLLSAPELTVGQTVVGEALVFTDITEVERQRREIERHRRQLDDFRAAITHELRNAITLVHGHLDLAEERLDPDADPTVADSLNTAAKTIERMTTIVAELATLADAAKSSEPTDVDIGAVARQAWGTSGAAGQFTVHESGTVEADAGQLERLFENLFRFLQRNGADTVELTYAEGQIVVTDDGEPLSETDIGRAFEFGEAVPDAESGMVLPVVRTLANIHGWQATIDTSYPDGVRTVIDTRDADRL